MSQVICYVTLYHCASNSQHFKGSQCLQAVTKWTAWLWR